MARLLTKEHIVDEPSEAEELGNNAIEDDWTPADEEKKPGRPQRACKPVKLLDGSMTSDEDDDEEYFIRGIKRKRGGIRGRGRARGRGRPTAAPKKGKGRGKKREAAEEQPVSSSTPSPSISEYSLSPEI